MALELGSRDVHGSGKDRDPTGPMGLPRNRNAIDHGTEMGIRRMGMGIQTLEWEYVKFHML